MKVSELISLLQGLPQDAVVVLPHIWESDDHRWWPIDPDSLTVTTSMKEPDGYFGRDPGDQTVVKVK